MEITSDLLDPCSRPVGKVVAEDYRLAGVFKRYGIDFCCGEDKTVREACEAQGIPCDEILRALAVAKEAAVNTRQPAHLDVRAWEPDFLANYIVPPTMNHDLYPAATPEMSARRTKLAPETAEAFRTFSKQVFAEGALDEKLKQLIAVAVAHVTQCPYCIKGHTKTARRKGATPDEIMEAIWVASEMRAGAAYAHAALAIDAMDEVEASRPAHT